jgi:hypothetical protein
MSFQQEPEEKALPPSHHLPVHEQKIKSPSWPRNIVHVIAYHLTPDGIMRIIFIDVRLHLATGETIRASQQVLIVLVCTFITQTFRDLQFNGTNGALPNNEHNG